MSMFGLSTQVAMPLCIQQLHHLVESELGMGHAMNCLTIQRALHHTEV